MTEPTPFFECECEACQAGCTCTPGWFLPGEAEALAASLGVPIAELFRTKLAVDYWCGDSDLTETFVLLPAITNSLPGEETPFSSHGTCVFYKNGKCEIHTAGKPYECAAATHDSAAKRLDIARAWQPHQAVIWKLLGRRPVVPEGSLSDALDILFRSWGLGS